jgi:hypothetical protein
VKGNDDDKNNGKKDKEIPENKPFFLKRWFSNVASIISSSN